MGRESRKISGGLPATVTNQTGALGKIVTWVSQAYIDLQNEKSDWDWLQDFCEGSLLSGQASYQAVDFQIDRFGYWITGSDPSTGSELVTLQDNALDRSDEQPIRFVPFNRFRTTYQRGANADQVGRPTRYSTNKGRLIFWPAPDRAFTVRVPYRKSPQVLTLNDDIPEMPEHHHMAIVWRALATLAVHDERFGPFSEWLRKHRLADANLRGETLPDIKLGNALV